MSLQRKTTVNISPIFYIVIAIIFINMIVVFPILILFIVLYFFKGKINLEKLLKNFGINDFMKKQFGANYEKIISEITRSKKYKQRVINNKNKRYQVEELFTDNMGRQIDENVELKREDKFKKMQQESEDKQNKEKIFYQQNQKTLQEKLAQSSKIKQTMQKKNYSFKNENEGLNSTKKTHTNYFGNSHKSKLFGDNKSIWDDYESVTDKFSSKNK